MANEPGIGVPITFETENAEVTLEKLAARIIALEETATKAGKSAGEGLSTGFAQGLGEKAFEAVSHVFEKIPEVLHQAIESSASFADQIEILGKKSGFATEQLQEMSLAAKTSGFELGSVTRFAALLTPKLLANEEAFRSLGLSFEEVAKAQPGEQFALVAEKLKGITDPARQVAAAVNIFGTRLGPQVLAFAKDLEEAKKRSHELGLVWSDETIKQASSFNTELDTLKTTQQGIIKSFGLFVTADKDLAADLKSTTGFFGEVNKQVQALGEKFHELPAIIKEGATVIALFGAQLAGAVPVIFSFFVGLKQLGGIGGAIETVKAFGEAAGITAARIALLGPALAVIGTAIAGFKLGTIIREELEKTSPFFKAFEDELTKTFQGIGEFLHLLPNAAQRARDELGKVALSDATPEQLRVLEEFKKKQAEVAANPPKPAAELDTKQQLEDQKKILQAQSQLNALFAASGGAISQANTARQTAVALADKELQITKTDVEKRKIANQPGDFAQELATAQKLHDIAVATANEQERQALAQEKLKDRTQEINNAKELFDLNLKLADVRNQRLGGLDAIAITQDAQNAAAQKEHDTKVQTLQAEIELKKLHGDALNDANRQIAQADNILATQQDINKAVAEQASLTLKIADAQTKVHDEAALSRANLDLGHALDDQLTGVAKIVAEREKELTLLRLNLAEQIKILTISKEGKGPDEQARIDRQIAALQQQEAVQEQILQAQAHQKSGLEEIIDLTKVLNSETATTGEKVLAVSQAFDKAAGAITGIINGVKGVSSALQQGGNFLQRGLAVGQAGGQLGSAIGGLIAGPVGAAVGKIGGQLIGGIVGALHKPEFQKVAGDVGKKMGVKISDELAKAIADTESKLKVSRSVAELLNISSIITESKKDARTFTTQIVDLMKGVAAGTIPAKEGIAEIGKAFDQVKDAALEAGKVGDRSLVALIKQSRASGIESPEIKQFVGEQLDAAAAGFAKFTALFKQETQDQIDKLTADGTKTFAGLSDDAVKKLANDSGVIFGGIFDALVSEKGIVGAVDQMKGSFDDLKDRLTKTLGQDAVNQILGPFGAAFDTIGNEALRPLFDGIDGLSQAMKGLANSGFITKDQFTALGHATKTLFDEAIAGGADMKTSLLAVSPAIQAAITASEQFGIPLDADTQKLKDLAEQNGITFKTDPQQAMLDVLVSIATVLGADIPESAKRAQKAVEDLAAATPNAVNVGGGGVAGGTSGPKVTQANVTVNLGINENPLANAQTAAEMRSFTVNTVAEAVQDRVPSIVAAIEAGQ